MRVQGSHLPRPAVPAPAAAAVPTPRCGSVVLPRHEICPTRSEGCGGRHAAARAAEPAAGLAPAQPEGFLSCAD